MTEAELELEIEIADYALEVYSDYHNKTVKYILDNPDCIPSTDLFWEKCDKLFKLYRKRDRLKKQKLKILKEIGD